MPRSRVLTSVLGMLLTLALATGTALAQSADLRARIAAGELGADRVLSAADLPGLQCGPVALGGVNWIAANLSGASFAGTMLAGGLMDDAILRGTRFADCDLTTLSLRRADMAGAEFLRCRLGGASFAAGSLAGARFEGNLYAVTGGRYLGALTAALNSLAGADGAATAAHSETFIAGLTGSAFSFVYDPTNTGRESTLPFHQNPLRAAAACLGADLKPSWDTGSSASAEALRRAVRASRPCLLPLSLAGGAVSGGDFAAPFWAVAQDLKEDGKRRTLTVLVPPFGQRELLLADLMAAWEGPWPTLEPAGRTAAEARFPLYVLTPASAGSTQAAVTVALRNAAGIITDRRTYGTQVPGAAGLQRLADDLGRASREAGLDGARALAAWDGVPRTVLVSAREAAAAFLEECGPALPDTSRAAVARAADLFRSEARILSTQLPSIAEKPADSPEQWKARLGAASRVISEVADLERAAAGALSEVL